MVAICTVLVAVMIWYLVPLLKNKLETEKQASIYRKIEQYVMAAEQLIQGAARGAERLDYVEKLLDEDGVTVTGQVRAMIEVAVYRMQIGGQRWKSNLARFAGVRIYPLETLKII